MRDVNVENLVNRMNEYNKHKKALAYSNADKYDEIFISYELQKPDSQEYSTIVIGGKIGEHTYILNTVNVGSGVIKLSDLTDIEH